MRLNRLLKYLNVLIAAVVVFMIVTVYWVAYRVLPKTSGTVNAPLSGEASVTRDENGVPHIQATSIEDALFLQGYVTAQDRLWQMDASRRYAAGELAEVVGSAALPFDANARKLRMRRIAERHAATLPPLDRSYLAAYARGVNYYIETHAKALPIEFTLMGYDPRPWMIADTILIGLEMYNTLTSTWKDELAKLTMLSAGDAKLVNELFPVRSGSEMQPGSNAWAISGKLTESGKPVLASDPHLPFSLPSTWYLLHMTAPGGLNVSGATLPGVPSVIVGHNDRLAWGVTNLHFDVQDLYLERIDMGTGQYLFRGRPAQVTQERELILVKDSRPVDFANSITAHGPLWTTVQGRAFTLRWIAAEPGTFHFPWVELNLASDWSGFRAALARFPGPAQNFIYADVDGNIGYQAAGRLPVRTGRLGDIPADGSTGQAEWESTIPFDQLPSVFNPPSGIIVSANQNPFPAEYPHSVHGNFAPQFREKQIRSLLGGKRKWTVSEMLAIQKDVYSAFNHFIAQQVVRAVDKQGTQSALTRDAANVLRSWNGQMEQSLAGPYIAMLLYRHLMRTFADRAAPGQGPAYTDMMGSAVIERLLRERPPHWFANFDAVLVLALENAVEEGRRIQGRNPTAWKYGSVHQVNIKHPVLSFVPGLGKELKIIGPAAVKLPWVDRYFNIGPVAMSGSATTVKQTSTTLGPSMRFVADLADWDKSLQNITIGQSGQFLSGHYRDQWKAYYTGKSLPMHWKNISGSTLLFVPKR